MWVFLQAEAADPSKLYDIIDRGGVIALLVIMVTVLAIGGVRGWYYFPPYVRRIENENTELKAKVESLSSRGDQMTATMVEVFRRRDGDR